MSTTSQWAGAVARDIGRLITGEISQADFAAAMAAATRDWTVSTSDIQELAAQVSSFLMRLQSFIVWDGPPPEDIGGLGTWCMNLLTGDIYGPKTAAGWGDSAFSLVGPKGEPGPTPDISITAQTGAAGSAATVTKGGTPAAPTFDFTIPRGDTGLTPFLTAGATTTGAPGSAAAVSMNPASTPEAPIFDFTLPEGQRGLVGPAPNVTAEIVMIPHGHPAVVTRSGPDTAPVLTFQLPTPLDGEDGREVEFNVSATHIQVRYEGDTEWTDLIALAALKGPKGDRGDAFTIGATGDNLAARDAYDAEGEGFSFLDTSTGLLYFRQTATAGVWSAGIPFGAAQSDILDALAALDAAEGVLVQVGPAAFAKRAIGVATGSSIPDRDAADARYRRIGQAVPLEDVTGLVLALEGKADAAAVLAALADKADAQATADALDLKADLVDGKVPAGQLATATTAQVRAGKATGVVIEPDEAAGAMAFTPLTDAATINPDLDTGPNFTLTTTAGVGVGRTIGLPTNGNVGQYYTIRVTADAAGRTLAWNTAFKWPGGTAQAIANAAGAITEVAFKMVSTSRFDVIGFVKDIR